MTKTYQKAFWFGTWFLRCDLINFSVVVTIFNGGMLKHCLACLHWKFFNARGYILKTKLTSNREAIVSTASTGYSFEFVYFNHVCLDRDYCSLHLKVQFTQKKKKNIPAPWEKEHIILMFWEESPVYSYCLAKSNLGKAVCLLQVLLPLQGCRSYESKCSVVGFSDPHASLECLPA